MIKRVLEETGIALNKVNGSNKGKRKRKEARPQKAERKAVYE